MSNLTRKGIYSRRRRSELGNVFFTLFGAVAVVGVLGAGIMATMRGPLSTMVEVNRREQAKAELRVAASLVLVAAADTCADGDGYTEAPDPGTPITGNIGPLPAVGSSQNDPWGNAYGYCAWDHGDIPANHDGCGTSILAGSTGTNNIAIAVLSAGPNGTFETTCANHAGGYVNPDNGGGDDIVVSMTYTQAITGSGGLWTDVSPTEASIARDLAVTGDTAITGALNITGTGTFTDVLAANSSMLLPTDDTTGFGDLDCTGGNIRLLRINDDPTPPVLEMCDGTNWRAAGSIWSMSGSNLFYMGGNVGIGLNNPDNTLDVAGTAEITGATTLGSTLDVTGTSTLGGTLTVNAASDFNGDVVITGSTTTSPTDALTVEEIGRAHV